MIPKPLPIIKNITYFSCIASLLSFILAALPKYLGLSVCHSRQKYFGDRTPSDVPPCHAALIALRISL